MPPHVLPRDLGGDAEDLPVEQAVERMAAGQWPPARPLTAAEQEEEEEERARSGRKQRRSSGGGGGGLRLGGERGGGACARGGSFALRVLPARGRRSRAAPLAALDQRGFLGPPDLPAHGRPRAVAGPAPQAAVFGLLVEGVVAAVIGRVGAAIAALADNGAARSRSRPPLSSFGEPVDSPGRLRERLGFAPVPVPGRG